MKRLKPEAYKQEANRRFQTLLVDLVCRLGEWNANKVLKIMEQQLKLRRQADEQRRRDS